MNALLLRNLQNIKKSASLQSFNEYRNTESANPQLSSVTPEGLLLEYETLELRLHPPNVQIDNEGYDDVTAITIDSANRPGTLIEVVQCLTELGLSIRRARISSDGGWFVDEFHVTESPRGKVLDTGKISFIKRLLSVDAEASAIAAAASTVFELAGLDCSGLLSNVLQLLVANGCEVTSAAVWTFQNRCALVVGVLDEGQPIVDVPKLQRLQASLKEMLGGEQSVVNHEVVRAEIHHERRLHGLLLLEELRWWEEKVQELQVGDDTIGGGGGGGSGDALAGADVDTRLATGGVDGGGGGGDGGCNSGDPGPGDTPGDGHASVSGGGGGGGGDGRGTPLAPGSPTASATGRVSTGGGGGGAGGGALLRTTPPGASPIAPAPTTLTAADVLAQHGARMGEWADVAMSPTKSGARAEVKIQHSPLLNYWLVTITSKDRNKLFFDTVCTLADMNYDVYHSTIDSEGDLASQLFYVRPRYGEAIWDEARAHKLKYMLESAVQRRFPKGLKIHVQSSDKLSLLELFDRLRMGRFWVTRAEVRMHHDLTMYNFCLTDNMGQLPAPQKLRATIESAGGVFVEDLEAATLVGLPPTGGVQGRAAAAAGAAAHAASSASNRFAFCFSGAAQHARVLPAAVAPTGGGGGGGVQRSLATTSMPVLPA